MEGLRFKNIIHVIWAGVAGRPASSRRPDALPLLIERELAALAHHQHIAKSGRTDRCRGASAFADLLMLIDWCALPEDRSERNQFRIPIEHDASIDLRNAFEHGCRQLGSPRAPQHIMQLILPARSI